MDFLIDSLVTNVFFAVVMLMVVLVLLLKLAIVSVTVIANSRWWSTYWWDTLYWNFTVKSIESIAWLLFSLCILNWFLIWAIDPLESFVLNTIDGHVL